MNLNLQCQLGISSFKYIAAQSIDRGVTNISVHAPHDMGDSILMVVYNLQKNNWCLRSRNNANKPRTNAKGTKNGAHLTVVAISFSLPITKKRPAKNIIPADNPPRNR